MAEIQRKQTKYMTRAEFNALDKTTVPVGTEINIVDQIQKEDLSTDLQNAVTKAENAIPSSGGTVSGDLTVTGNLTVSGTTTTIESTTMKVKDKLIEVASDNTSALTTPAGLVAPKYDGTNSGALVFDNTGTAYVGDVTLDTNGNIDVNASQLQPLATRNLSADDNGKMIQWDNDNKTLVGSVAHTVAATGNTVVQRDANGQINLPDQTIVAPAANQAISKQIADNTYALKESVGVVTWHDSIDGAPDILAVIATEITINPATDTPNYIFHDSKCVVPGYRVNNIRGSFPLNYVTGGRFWYGNFTGTISADTGDTLVGASGMMLAGVVTAATEQSGDTENFTVYARDGSIYSDAAFTFRFLW